MADLDDLFGAFDGGGDGGGGGGGDGDGGKGAKTTTKRARSPSPPAAAADAETDVVVEVEEGGVERSDANADADAEAAPPTAAAATKEGGAGGEAPPTEGGEREAAGGGGGDDGRLIATGTSHDKSIRSYTALPPAGEESSSAEAVEAKDEGKDEGKEELEKRPPAKVYPFKLDPFQQTAVDYVERGESVLVAAHTSAGKTAVAEYAVAKSLRDGQRVIYTSPIKALSNQKYRDLQEEFGDVGLMTGDITINPAATCLVMTTEVLRSMLYRGSEIMREVAWVIYDEVHYMRDKERGVVWEESIVLLPHRVRFVFLSATIPNAAQFVRWIAKVHHQPCHVVYTNYRPVPLQHYIFPNGGDGLYLVVDEKGKFREGNFQKAMARLQGEGDGGIDGAVAGAVLNSGAGGGGGGRKRRRGSGGQGGKGQQSDLHRIVKLVMTRGLNPVIVFSFSKKDCEKYALQLHRQDYNDEVEKDLISQVYTNAIESLGEDDKKLPQVEALLPLLKRGIGIHHGGLLPILKEIVEILFSEGLIKCLFATETFAIGINMPAKTVVFTNTRKWDGKDFRWVTSGEYIQMSGRAGRRGKDDRGIVIQMMDEKMEPSVCKDILYGEPDPLNSSYQIRYNMLLNMMRVEDVDPEYLLRASFHQYQQESEAPALDAQADSLEEKAAVIDVGNSEEESVTREYYDMNKQLEITQSKIMRIMRRPEYIVKFLNAGRLVEVTIDGENFGWGPIVAVTRKTGTGAGGSAGKQARQSKMPERVLDVLLPCVDKERDDSGTTLRWKGSAKHCRPVNNEDADDVIEMRIFSVVVDEVHKISAVRLCMPQQDIHQFEARQAVGRSLNEVKRRWPVSIPLLDPVKDVGLEGEEFERLTKRAKPLLERLSTHKLSELSEDEREQRLEAYGKKTTLLEQSRTIRREAKACQTMVMRDELKKMKKVLRELGHVDANSVILTKGRTACEINTTDELVVVEMVFAGVFNELSVEQCVALLSCMTFDERVKDDDGDATKGLKSYLLNPFHKLQEAARTVVRAQIACKIDVDEDEFVEKFNPGMMEAVFAWCKGAKFVDVQKLTGSYEGTTIRCLRRLEELVRQLSTASKAIGNHELEEKFTKGSEMIKRDIVFCSSLYL